MHPNIAQYLHALQLPMAAPSLPYLQRLIAAQHQTFPYENVSKLMRLEASDFSAPGLAEFVGENAATGSGGTCFAQNAHFAALLDALGFDAELIGVTSGGEKDAHASILARIAGDRYHVDLGLMSTFSGPLPLSGQVIERSEGYRTWRFTPTNEGTSFKLEIWRKGVLHRDFSPQPGARLFASFAPVIARSFLKEAIFMRNLVVFRVLGNVTHTLWNNEYHRTEEGLSTTTVLKNTAEMKDVISSAFDRPRLPIERAARILRDFNGVDIFAPKIEAPILPS